jgi:hypothetical protein
MATAAPAAKQPETRIVWDPTPQQKKFLACPDWEVLYGGAAGGGKSDAMLIDAWCAEAEGYANPNHRAVIFRKQFVDLLQLIERGLALFPMLMPGIKYNQQTHTFTTPAGAKLQFAHCANDSERFNWRGFAWNWIGFEEITLWATPLVFQYIKSRCRTTDRRLPRYIRATTNPDGPGQKWVMEHWGIQEDGGPALIERDEEFEELEDDGKVRTVMRRVRRRFIPAKLSDNPHLAGTGYRETLNELPPEEREQLLEGKWTGNRIRGAYFFREMQRARHEGRIRVIPHLTGVPVNTFWDLGWNDVTAIWFHQYAALANRFLLTYQNSGETLAHYAAYLQKLSAERGFVYGTHYLPHDAANKSLQTGKSAEQILRAALPGHRFVVVPRVEQKLIAIHQARAAFPTCWFDGDDCADGIAALDAYRKKWSPTQEIFLDEPVHDQFSNLADAFQQFGQGYHSPANGGVPANRRDSGSTRAATRSGWKQA